MHRRYNRWHSRFDQPDPYGGSYDQTDPQSFNRYSYVQNDPVNFVDPSGLDECPAGTVKQLDALGEEQCVGVGVTPVTVPIGSGQRSGGAVGASSGPIEIETPTSPTEAELVPQTPEGEPLSDCVKNLLAKYFDRGLLDSIRIHTNGLPSFVPSEMTAYTSNNNVYYARGEYHPHTAAGIALIGHEATHSEQYRQNGNLRFKAKYLFSSLVAGIGVTVGRRGSVMPRFDSKRAYYGNKYEMDAERKEQQILNDLNQEYGGNNPCP